MDCGGIPRSSKRSCERRNGKSFVLDVRGVASRLIIRHARPGLVIDVKELVGHDCGNAVCRLFAATPSRLSPIFNWATQVAGMPLKSLSTPALTVTQSGCQIFGPFNDALRTPYSVFSLSTSRPSASFYGAVSFDPGMPLGVNMVLKPAATIFPVFASRAARKISM